ncbi:MAG: GH36 C-terminal domain-containing protein [Verrucomicrobiota bacterium]
MKPSITSIALVLIAALSRAAEPATVSERDETWTLQNEALQAVVPFSRGSLSLTSYYNREAKMNYLEGQPPVPLFSFVIGGKSVAANDGGWALVNANTSDIELYGIKWGKRLEITLKRTQPVAFSIRQVFEIYNGRTGLRCVSFLKNEANQEQTIESSEVLAINFPNQKHNLAFVERIFTWRETTGSLSCGGRNGIVRYDSGDGWFCAPENNWATSLTEGQNNASPSEKLLGLDIFNGGGLRVTTNPKAVQLTLYPHEEIEWLAVNLGVFVGDIWDGRMAVAEHLRQRFKFHDPSRLLSVNDWQWGAMGGKRTDKNYREIVIPKAAAAGFDLVNIDAEWYTEDGTAPARNWTDMKSLCDFIAAQGMKPGHWFPLQGKGGSCALCWYSGHGRDAANPTNIDFKLKQTEEDLIGKYHSAWGQLDCGLLWKTDKPTGYSHPGDSVYRKLLGMRRYVNTITRKFPDYLMHITCEIDNPGTSRGDQNTGLAHMGDNTIIGTFNRAETGDDLRDLFASFGQFPMEASLATPGEGGASESSWSDSPLWYYQFLLARHTSIYSWPGNWSDESVAHLRVFNDWRKNPRIKSLLNEPLRPVYNGTNWLKNEGPWAWMFTDEQKSKALLFAINHLDLATDNQFTAKLRWLDPAKVYLIEEITQNPHGEFAYGYRGEYAGRDLVRVGLPINLEDRPEPCAAFWIQEKASRRPQVLYADAAIFRYTEKVSGSKLAVDMEATANSSACLFVFKSAASGVERREVKLDGTGRGRAEFDAATVTDPAKPLTFGSPAQPSTAAFAARDATTAGRWRSTYGTTAAWLAGHPPTAQEGYSLRLSHGTSYIWGKDDQTARVLELPPGAAGSKLAACWTAGDEFDLRLKSPKRSDSYKLTVYLMDYDNVRYPARAMEVSLRARDGKVLDTQRATKEETAAGIYLTWKVSGAVTIHARKTEGFNAAVSGVFVDAPPAEQK